MATEKELDRALAVELETNPKFLEWFVSQTKFVDCEATFQGCRTNHPWGVHPFPVVDSSTGESISTQRQSETDVLLVVSDKSARILGIHIENKVGKGKFTDLQAEMYAHRAAHWIGNNRYGGYMDFETVLVAPKEFLERYAGQALLFGCSISHEAIGEHIPLFNQI